jgi:hypothetical protein
MKGRATFVPFLVAFAFAPALASAASPPPPEPNQLDGIYGGEHAAVSFYDFGVNVEFDCASGWIDTPISLDASGAFTAPGTYTPIEPQSAIVPADQPAIYRGQLHGDWLTLEVDVGGQTLGPFHVGLNHVPLIDSCLW